MRPSPDTHAAEDVYLLADQRGAAQDSYWPQTVSLSTQFEQQRVCRG